jgi:hypothetical protein
MRVTDHRYAGELARFDLAVRLIEHEARTGTIRACTGFSEDRIRKIYTTYFKCGTTRQIKRRRGKSPTRVAQFISSAPRQLEATVLAGLFLLCQAGELHSGGRLVRATGTDRVALGQRLCQAFETYLGVHPEPRWSFEWAWNLYHSLVDSRDLYFAHCDSCGGPYVQDSFALDYRRCPFCEMRDQRDLRLGRSS